MNLLDKILLPRETKNLARINDISEKINNYLDKNYLEDLKKEYEEIDTIEHKDKIKYWIEFINLIQQNENNRNISR